MQTCLGCVATSAAATERLLATKIILQKLLFWGSSAIFGWRTYGWVVTAVFYQLISFCILFIKKPGPRLAPTSIWCMRHGSALEHIATFRWKDEHFPISTPFFPYTAFLSADLAMFIWILTILRWYSDKRIRSLHAQFFIDWIWLMANRSVNNRVS